jgi:hypothetical protein
MPSAIQTVRAAVLACLLASAARGDALALVHEASAYADAEGEPLKAPEGVACSTGSVLVADSGNGRLVTYVSKDGALVPGAVFKTPQLGYPVRLQVDAKGGIWSLDGRSRRIVRLGADGRFASFFEMKGVPARRGIFVQAFRVGASGEVFVLDVASARVIVVDAAGAFRRQVDLPEGAVMTDIEIDPAGSLYAVESARPAVYVSRGGGPFRPLTSNLSESASFPAYAAAAERGLLLAVDRDGAGIVVLGPDGSYLGRRLGLGWTEGLLYYPGQICLDGKGGLFVPDRGNASLQAFAIAR